jgi:hypothetical protein
MGGAFCSGMTGQEGYHQVQSLHQGLPVLQNPMPNKFLFLANYPACGVLLQQPKIDLDMWYDQLPTCPIDVLFTM